MCLLIPKDLLIQKKEYRAFTKTGLKVLFYLLQHKEAINFTQREIADYADVGLGNTPHRCSMACKKPVL
jgi:DNA-binding MarR family transcriptional regulator